MADEQRTDQTGQGGQPGQEDPRQITVFRSRSDGQLHFRPDSMGTTFPVTAPTDATPLDEGEPEDVIPPSPLWAMKDRRHEQLLHPFGHAERIRQAIGDGDDTVYLIDDGRHHRMIGRRVGATGDGCVYSLIGRITRKTHQALVDGSIDARQAFLDAHELGLDGTAEDPNSANVSNIFDVAYYDHPEDVPVEYLPPNPFITFAEDLPTADH